MAARRSRWEAISCMAASGPECPTDPIPERRRHAEVPPVVDVVMRKVIALQIGPQAPRQAPLMAAVVEDIVSEIGEREASEECQSDALTQHPNGADENAGKDRHRHRERHDIATGVGWIGVVTAMYQKTEGR